MPSGNEYQPRSPPMPSIGAPHVGGRRRRTAVSRSSRYTVPPLHSGSVGSGSLAAPGHDAPDQRVGTSAARTRWQRAPHRLVEAERRRTGAASARSCSVATTELRSDSISGCAIAFGTGVTRLTQWLESHGVRTGTGDDHALLQPGDLGEALHHLAVA